MNIKVRQIYFRKEQVSKISENCFPYYNTSDFESDLFLEYSVILKSYLDGFFKEGDFAGVLSWRFLRKREKLNQNSLTLFAKIQATMFILSIHSWNKLRSLIEYGNKEERVIRAF